MTKVKVLGIDGRVYNWMKAWLSGGKQRVRLNYMKSNWSIINSGVGQGFVLGPLLIIIYMNYLDSGINSNISKFAYDTKIGRQISSEQEAIILHGELNRMYEWAFKWQMDFNINKCSTLHVGRHNTRNRYNLSKLDITKSNSEKDLGVVVSFIAKNVSNTSADKILRFYFALVKFHLNSVV